ncbi:MAG: TonB-dependent receptor plug domain-containing protein, partial [bacterium]|nr:TonB-dependent receptor plug domain-containing protein [Candidatus Kapabacteria bacterium]
MKVRTISTRIFLLIALLLGFGPSKNTVAYAQAGVTGTITGTVVDSATRESLVGAAVFVDASGRRIGVATSRNGAFTLSGVPVGATTVHARLIGYRQAEAQVNIAANVSVNVIIELSQRDVAMRPVEVIGESPEVHSRMVGTATRVDARALASIAPIGTQEVLQYIPGVNAASDDGIGNSRISVGIRGLSPRRSARVLVLEDGIPIAPAVYLYPNMYYNPPAERVDAVEVIKGSAAIRYGPQTMGGVINYLTSRPRSSFGALGQLSVGTNGYISALAEIGGWGSDVIHPEIQLLYKRGDGYRSNNSFAQYNATLKVNVLPDEDRILYIKGNVDHEVSDATYTGLTEYSFAA